MSKSASLLSLELKSCIGEIDEVLDNFYPGDPSESFFQEASGRVFSAEVLCSGIVAPGRDILDRGGKRWRPLMAVLLNRALGSDRALAVTPLIELPHNGSLIIDDIEDSSPKRRGKPTIHLLYGEDRAINCGNFLYFLPSTLIATLPFSEKERVALYEFYLGALRRLHMGQGFDIEWHKSSDLVPSVEEYDLMCRFKTGSIARLAAEIAALLAEEESGTIEALGEVWESLGVAFQVFDDILNLVKGAPGKLQGDDIIEGKKSLPLIFSVKKAPHIEKELFQLMKEARIQSKNLEVCKQVIDRATTLLRESGGVERAMEYGLSLINKGRKSLIDTVPDNRERELLLFLLEQFIPAEC